MSQKTFNQLVSETKKENTTNKSTQNVGVENTANSEKQPKGVRQISKENFRKLLNSYVRVLAKNFDAMCEKTQNGALKLTTSLPECRADVKATAKVGTKIFYCVPTGETRVAVSSYLSYLEDVAALAERQANFPTFAEWSNQSTQKAKIQFAISLGLNEKDVVEGLKKQYEEKKKEIFG